MNKTVRVLLAMLLIANTSSLFSQIQVTSISASASQLFDLQDQIDYQVFGGTWALDIPIKNISIRVEYSYSLDDFEKSMNTQTLTNFGLYVGTIINRGKRLQFPIYIGYGTLTSRGNVSTKSKTIGPKAEVRFYLSDRIAIVASGSASYLLNRNAVVSDSSGTSTISDLTTIHTQFNVGFSYLYYKRR